MVKPLKPEQLKDYLDTKVQLYNQLSFISEDPISIPHAFTSKEDREISGFLAATIAWGQRPIILRNCQSLMERMDHAPADFIRNHSPSERCRFQSFVHRTFNGTDCSYFLKALQKLVTTYGSLEGSFSHHFELNAHDLPLTISSWRADFLSFNAPDRTGKHIANPSSNSSAKRICMYLRWMVRKDKSGVDFGIWKSIPPSSLYIPLDVHSGRIARMLHLLERKQDDWKAVVELTQNLRKLDPMDPVKYDFALFGIGVNEKF